VEVGTGKVELVPEYLRVKNWEKFQHYSHRNPPWIRLYSQLLDDPDFATLPDASKAHLMGIWLLASRTENKIPLDAAFIAGRINAKESVDLNLLIERGFLLPASKMLATCKQNASSETETETEKNRKEPPTPLKGGLSFVVPDWVPKEPWEGFIEMRKSIHKPPKTERALKLLVGKLETLKEQGHDPNEVLNQSTMNAWQGIFELRTRTHGSNPEPRVEPEKPAQKPKTREQVWDAWCERANSLRQHYSNQPGEFEKLILREMPDYPDWLQEQVKEYMKK
jgi:hypothetical protein